MFRLLLAAGAWLAAIQPLPLHAQSPGGSEPADTLTLSLADTQRRAVAANPTFQGEREEIAAAGGDLRQARAIAPNPRLEFESPGAASGGSFGRYEAALTQEIEWAGQRGLRIDAAESAVDRAEATTRDAGRRTIAEASRAYYELYASRRRLEVAEEILAASERLASAVTVQLEEGEISALEANLVQIEASRGRSGLLAARREARSAELALSLVIGTPSETSIRLAPVVPNAPEATTLRFDALLETALSRRSDLEAAQTAVAEADASARLAGRSAIPNVEISALAEREVATDEPLFGLGLGFPVTLWDRNRGTSDRMNAEVRRARWFLSATEAEVRAEVADAYQAYLSASEEAAIYERDVLEPAGENHSLLETAYREGKIDLPAFLILRNQLLDAQLSYWDAWLAHRRALVALESATGTIGLGVIDFGNPNPGAGSGR